MTTPSSPSPRVRLSILLVVVGCLFATLLARLWFLQVVNAPRAQAAAQGNGIKVIYTPAPRGEILSSDGQVLAGNVPSEVITVDRQIAQDNPAMEPRLAALLGLTLQQLKAAISTTRVSPYAPVPVKTGVNNDQILYIKEHQALFPGVQASLATQRSYPLGPAAANIVGFTGQINGTQYKALKAKGYEPSDQIGDAGVEATFESVLRGKPGEERVSVDSRGDVLGVIGYTPPVPGDNVVLTINAADQQAAYTTLVKGLATARTVRDPLSGRNFAAPAGAVVIENPTNGQVLALATAPDYDDNQFVGGISQADYQALQSPASDLPLNDRAISGVYQPGSTFKLITATAALQYGMITPDYVYDDRGEVTIGNQVFHNDSNASYGPVNLQKAITVSSDSYFYQLGANFFTQGNVLGPDALQNVAKAYGFGAPTGINLTGEAGGLVPDAQVVAKEHAQNPAAYPNGTWYEGDAVQTAIGEEQVGVTPLQLDNAYATFANGGTRYVPQIAERVQTPAGKLVAAFAPKSNGNVTIAPANRAAMLAGFEGVTSNPGGTAYNDFTGFPILVGGKTGTAQVSNASPGSAAYKQTTSVFASFAPAPTPQYAVDCFMEQAGYGADSAAPVVRSIYNVLYNQQPAAPVGANASGHD